jgi:carboxylesterase type B
VYEGWGASHFAELLYVFDHLNQEPWSWSSADRKVAEEISSYWVNFARSGNPNSPDLPSWSLSQVARDSKDCKKGRGRRSRLHYQH